MLLTFRSFVGNFVAAMCVREKGVKLGKVFDLEVSDEVKKDEEER